MSNQPAAKVSEIHLGRLDNFDGSASKASAWLDSVTLYLMVNESVYDSNQKKITFALSFIKEDLGATWASTFTKKALTLAVPRSWNLD